MNKETDLISLTKINSKWNKDTNIKCKPVKLLGDNIQENLEYLGYDDDILDLTSQIQSMKEITDRLYLLKIKMSAL